MIIITMIIKILIGIIRIIMRAISAIIIIQRIFRKTEHVGSMSRK